MGIHELRQHIRFRTEGRAQLRLEGGVCIPCSIRDISMGGAYLIREGEPSRPVQIEPGARARIRVHDPESGSRYTLSADIVRVEPDGGRGIAVRFRITEENVDPVVDYVSAAAERVGLAPDALRMPTIRVGRRRWGPTRRVADAVVRVSVLASLAGFGVVGMTWLDSVLF